LVQIIGVLAVLSAMAVASWHQRRVTSNFFFSVTSNCCMLFTCRPNHMQIIGVLAVLAGVAVASWPSGSSAAAAAAAAEIEPMYLLLCIVSFAFPALATIIKERIFKVSMLHFIRVLLHNMLSYHMRQWGYCSQALHGALHLLLTSKSTLSGQVEQSSGCPAAAVAVEPRHMS
jgi:hypothetical protein